MAPRPRTASTAKGVSRLPDSAFAYPASRKYPINTAKRARAALAFAARSDTAGTKAHVLRRIKSSSNPAVRAVGKRSTAKSSSSSTTRKRRSATKLLRRR